MFGRIDLNFMEGAVCMMQGWAGPHVVVAGPIALLDGGSAVRNDTAPTVGMAAAASLVGRSVKPWCSCGGRAARGSL